MNEDTTKNDRRQRGKEDSSGGEPGHAHTRTRGDGAEGPTRRERYADGLGAAGRTMSLIAGMFALAMLATGIGLGLGIKYSILPTVYAGDLTTLAMTSGETILVCIVFLGLGESLREVSEDMGGKAPEEVRA